MMRSTLMVIILALLVAGTIHATPAPQSTPTFIIPDTGQAGCYDPDGTATPCPTDTEAYFGQDATYVRAQPSYHDNGDGTVTDLVTGLMWQKTYAAKMDWQTAANRAASIDTGGYSDWRLPTIKELYSLMVFTGVSGGETAAVAYLDTHAFDFAFGDTSAGERSIDAQYWSSTRYVSTTMNEQPTAFGVNFADGRIKGYPTRMSAFVRYVRGGDGSYGVNAFVDNGDGTLTDSATGLTWLTGDSGSFGAGAKGDGLLDWAEALQWCESLDFAGATDWRLPDAKELQAIVDYTRSPDTTASAAIDPRFVSTPITDEGGTLNYAMYWSSTTHLDGPTPGDRAVYVAFGEALGYMSLPPTNQLTLYDVHGAGAQRSDPKDGNAADIPIGDAPQGDVYRIDNMARCVRGGEYEVFTGGEPIRVTSPLAPPQNGTGQQPQNGLDQPQAGQPPQAALDACSGLSQGAACSFTTPQGTLSGTCGTTPAGVFACMPAGGPPPTGN